MQPYGALTLFFRWRKKSVQKKASGTATPGKSPLLPILEAGLAMSRAAELASYACYRARSELAFFRRQNGRAFFPSLPIAALLPRSRRGAGLPLAGWDASVWLGEFCSLDEWTDFLCPVGGGQAYPLRVEVLQCSSYIFATQKASGISNPRWPFEASHEACRRMAVFTVQAAGSRTRPVSRGTCRATAVKPRPSCMFLYAPARPRRAVRGAGVLPLLSFCQRLRRFSRMARRSPKSRAPTPYTR